MGKRYPFKFLDAYTKKDTDIFFGRDEEVNALYEMVFQSNILLIYGASGTGKTSLIQCGLSSRFKPHQWMDIYIRRGNGTMSEALEKALKEAGEEGSQVSENLDWLDNLTEESGSTSVQKTQSPLEKSFKAIYLHHFKPIYLIFDQFEELYILGSKEEQVEFIQKVKEILDVEQPVKMIFIIREEYLGHLYEFEKEVPELLRKKLRVEAMNLDKVRQVITGATGIENSNVRLKKGEEEALALGIFEKIRGNEKKLTIQLPYLQVFLDKLYLETTHDESRKADAILTSSTLEKLGDIGDVLRHFLENQTVEISRGLAGKYKNNSTEIIWKVLSPFVTLDGTKEPISKQNLYDRLKTKDIEEPLVDDIIEAFVKSRILRYSKNDDLYEIAHDALALQISSKRTDEEIALLEVRRLIKSQSSLKDDAREFFSEKQVGFIEPYLEKIDLTVDEMAFFRESQKEISIQKEKVLNEANARAEKEQKLRLEAEQQAKRAEESEKKAEENAAKEKKLRKKAQRITWLAALLSIIVLVFGFIVVSSLWKNFKIIKERKDFSKRFNQNMVAIPAGTFKMGCTSGDIDCEPDEMKVHDVKLSRFRINKYEVTQEEWRAVMGNNPSSFIGCDKCPVERVSWNDIEFFVRLLNEKTGAQYRLPTEAEWEYAARGGEDTLKYAGSSELDAVAWYYDNSERKTHPVGEKKANGYGLYDMTGNVWEWCNDWYDEYEEKAQKDPSGPEKRSYRVFRGGGWGNDAQSCRVSDRDYHYPDNRSYYIGFRLAHRY